MRATRAIRAAAVSVALVVGCTTATPTPTAPTSGASTAPPTTAPSSAGQTITFHAFSIPSVSNWFASQDVNAWFRLTRMVHAAVYRHDSSLAAVPDLAAEPCEVDEDLVTITCTLRSATFHDGAPVTADDVAYMYELVRSPSCPFDPNCLSGRLRDVEAMDERTVRFTLERPDAPFLSSILAAIVIQPRQQIEAAFAAFTEVAGDVGPERAVTAADQVRERLGAAQPECDAGIEIAEEALTDLRVTPLDRGFFVLGPSPVFDACAYADYLAYLLEQAGVSLETEGIDAVAEAYPLLAFNAFDPVPIGAGPWKFTGDVDPEQGFTLSSHDAYHHGAPATHRIEVRAIPVPEEMADALGDGSLDWVPTVFPGTFQLLRDLPGVKYAAYPSFTYAALQFNVREGMLFADRSLRQAVALCIDKEQIVEASVPGATAIYSPIPPGSWAYEQGLARPRDVAAARGLIEASGWREGDDGIYVRGEERLSAVVPARADIPPAIAQVERVALQARDCGIELASRPVEFREALAMVDRYPHHVPGTAEPFEAYFGGWIMTYDPDVSELFHSSRISSETQTGLAGGFGNYIGFSNDRVDALLDEGLRTYEQDRRAEIYRKLQRILDEEQPYLFMGTLPVREALDEDLASTAGEPDLDSPNWWWQLETLVNRGE